MSRRQQTVGKWGEAMAAAFLLAKGYTIIAHNYRTPYGEIDMVTCCAGATIFVEVKTRTTHTYGYPEDSITPRKQAHLTAAAEHYTQQNNLDHWQIDVISIEGQPGGRPRITHFKNVLA
jgi:putative endonuclease